MKLVPEFNPYSGSDPVGVMFFSEGRIFRAIRPNAVEHIRNLFHSGLIDELVNNDLFPESHV